MSSMEMQNLFDEMFGEDHICDECEHTLYEEE